MTAMSHSLQENRPFAESLFAETGFLGHRYLLGVYEGRNCPNLNYRSKRALK
jgi:hypothetical protein